LWGGHLARPVNEAESLHRLFNDERLGRQIAEERGIAIIGTLGILDDAADQGLINLAEAIAQLQQTNFPVSRRIIQALLNKPKN
jgi:predicted nucleic acid-binding protein